MGISDERKAFLERDFRQGFIAYCHLEGELLKKGHFRSRVEIGSEHRQQDGFVHAGVMATMADHTAGYAAFSTVEEGFRILTIEFKINFLRPAFGNTLVCNSQVIRGGNRIIIADSEVFDRRDETDFPVAKALVTLMAIPDKRISSED